MLLNYADLCVAGKTVMGLTFKQVFYTLKTRNFVKTYYPLLAIPICAVAGSYLTSQLDEERRTFHNKSAMFGGQSLKAGEKLW